MPPNAAPKAPPSITIGGLTLTYVEGAGVSAKVQGSPVVSKPLDCSEAFTLAEWLRSRGVEELEVQKQGRWERLKAAQKQAELQLGQPRRYWLCFTTRLQARAGYPFPVWEVPLDAAVRRLGDRAFCTLIDSARMPASMVADYWPDAKERYCAEKPAGWEPPADRFPPQPSEASP